jgi:hypothetical protein
MVSASPAKLPRTNAFWAARRPAGVAAAQGYP